MAGLRRWLTHNVFAKSLTFGPKDGYRSTRLQSQSWGGRNRRLLGACWPDTWAGSVSLASVKDESQSRGQLGKTVTVDLWLPLVHAHAHTRTHTHACTYAGMHAHSPLPSPVTCCYWTGGKLISLLFMARWGKRKGGNFSPVQGWCKIWVEAGKMDSYTTWDPESCLWK